MTEQRTEYITDEEYDNLVRSLAESDNGSLYEIRLSLVRKGIEGILPLSRTSPGQMIDSLLRLGMVSDEEEALRQFEDERMEHAMRGIERIFMLRAT